MSLHTLFDPKSVAVVGATSDESKVGYALMKNIVDSGTREVYPVTLSENEVLGHVAYTSIKMIPGKVDLAVIAIRADIVSSILRECAEKEIKTAVVISAGFKEMGEEGKKLEDDMAVTARQLSITLLGPNCLGVMNAQADWNASFAVNKPKPGSISFVSQSGALGTALLDWANREGVGFSKFVSLGNEAQLSELEFLEYLADDESTSAVLLYLEQVSDGPRFLELAKRVTEKKPLVVLRAGRSERGSKAVASHTGSLAPSDAIFGAALRQVGAIPVDSLRTLFSLTKLFELGHYDPLQRLVILTNGGGPSVNTADLVEATDSLTLVDLSDETKAALMEVLPPMAAVNNPIDVIGDAGPERYDGTLEVLTKLNDVDAIVTLVTPQMMTDPHGIAEVLTKHKDNKPLIPVFMGGATMDDGVAALHEHSMVAFNSPTDIAEALHALARGAKKPGHKAPATHDVPGDDTLVMDGLEDMRNLLDDYDIHLEGAYVTTQDDVEVALKKLGDGPYAIKAISGELVHKSDLRAVQLGLADAAAVTKAWNEIVKYVEDHTPGATIDGMLIQQMVSGTECIIGMKRDPVFGPVVVFGLGGIFVEILKDASMRVAPVTKDEALEQVREIKGLPLLTGARGKDPVKLEDLAAIVSALSHLALDYPEVEEVDLNPVFATPKGTHVVDARIMRKRNV